MKTFQAEILIPQKPVFSGEVEALVLNGALGSFGVLAGHAPMIARLSAGKLKVTREGREYFYQAGAGFAQIIRERVSILVNNIQEIPAV